MAYRKTEKVLAAQESRKAELIGAALHLITKQGTLVGLTAGAITKRAKVADGLLYTYFADKDEVVAAAVAQILSRDLALLSGERLQGGLRAWLRALRDQPRLMSVIATLPAYREGIKAELYRLLRADGADTPSIACAVVYGAMVEAARSIQPRDETTLVALLMRSCGLRVRYGV